MKMRKTFSAAAIVAVLSCSAAHAQVLGGGVGGAVNGAVGGGLRDTSVFGNGNANGSFGGQLDTGSMIDRTRGTAQQTTHRARNVGANVRNRTESTVAAARDSSASTATSAAAATATQLDATKLSSAADAAATHSSAIEPSIGPQQSIEPQPNPKKLDPSKLDVAPKLDSVAGSANGSASGNASASRRGVAADVAADGNASANVGANKDDTQE